MAQFSPDMSKEELVNQFSNKNNFFNEMSTEEAYTKIVNQYPQYKLNSEESKYAPATKRKTNLWDSLPSPIRKGYNDSIQGMSYEMATGNKRFDISDYDPGVINDLGAGVASFFAPLDFATTVIGGGLGGAATKALVRKYVFKKLVKNGALKTTAGRAAIKASEFAATSGSGAGALGLYSGAADTIQQKITDGTIDVGKVVKTSAKGALLGGMTGFTNAFLTQKGANVLTKTASEVFVFGAGAPILEGKVPSPQDFVHAGGMILGIKGVNKVATTGYQKIKKFSQDVKKAEFNYEIIPEGTEGRKELYKASSETEAIARLSGEKGEKVWTDWETGKRGVVVSESPKSYQFKPFGEKTISVNRDRFANFFRSTSKTELSPKEVSTTRKSDIRAMEKELGHNSKVKETNRALLIEKTDVKKKISLDSMSEDGLIKLRDKHKLEMYTKESLKNFEKIGIRMVKPRVSMFMDKILPEKINKLFDVVRPAKNQGSVDQVRRAYVGLADTFFTDSRRVVAQSHDLMQRGGFLADKPSSSQVNKLAEKLNISPIEVSKNYWEYLSDAVEKGIELPETIQYRSITDYLFNTAKQSGVDVSGYFDKYIPKILKENVAEEIFADIEGLAKIIFPKSKLSKDEKVREKLSTYQDITDLLLQAKDNPDAFIKNNKSAATFLNGIIKGQMNKFKSEKTKQGMTSLIEEGGELAYFKAMTKLQKLTYGELFRIDGNIEKKRTVNLPNNFYERDIRKLLGIYSSNVARRSAEVKNFGRKGELANVLIDKANKNDAEIIRELHHHVMGDIAYKRAYNFNPSVKNFLQKAVEWETATKIGLGTASAMNLSQFTISSALSAGYWRFGKGAYKYYTDKEFRRQVDASGADLYKYVNELMEISAQSALSKKLVMKLTDISQFNRINSYNNILAAASARVFVDDLVAVVSGKRNILNPGQMGSKKWAKATLIKMGVDPSQIKKGKVEESTMLNVLAKFATDTQLQKNVLNDPIVLNRPTWKPFLQFKGFGYRQYNFIKETLTHDAVHYNFLPMLRLAGAGFATGAISLKAKEYMKYILSGEESYDPAKFLEADGKEIIENIAAVGAFGYIGDFMMSALDEGKTTSKALQFLATPAFVSDIDNFLNHFLPSVENDYKNYRGDFIKRLPARTLKLTGAPVFKDLVKRDWLFGETKGMKKDRLTFLRGRRKSSILDMLVKSETKKSYDQAFEDMLNWNKAYPNYPLTYTDIDINAVHKRKLQKWEKRKDI